MGGSLRGAAGALEGACDGVAFGLSLRYPLPGEVGMKTGRVPGLPIKSSRFHSRFLLATMSAFGMTYLLVNKGTYRP